MLSLRSRPTGICRVPVAAIGVRSVTVASLVFGTTCTHSLSAAMICSTSSSGTSRVSLRVRACEWERMAPIRTHSESNGIRSAPVSPSTLLVSS